MTPADEDAAAFERILVAQLSYFFPLRSGRPSVSVSVTENEGAVSLEGELTLEGASETWTLEGTRFEVLEACNRVLARGVELHAGVELPFMLSTNVCSPFLGDVGQRPVGATMLHYWVLPLVADGCATLAAAARAAGDVDADALARYGAEAFFCGAHEIVQGTAVANPYAAALGEILDSATLAERLAAELRVGDLFAWNAESPPALLAAREVRTRSVVKALQARTTLIHDMLDDPAEVVAAIGDLEFLVRHDIREEKHRRRVWPIMTEVLRELLAHSNGCIRRRARHLAGLWLNHHLCFLAEAGDARHEIFATIVHDCPMISLASLAVSYEMVGRADDATRVRDFRRFYVANRELDPQLPVSPYRPRANDEFEPPERP